MRPLRLGTRELGPRLLPASWQRCLVAFPLTLKSARPDPAVPSLITGGCGSHQGLRQPSQLPSPVHPAHSLIYTLPPLKCRHNLVPRSIPDADIRVPLLFPLEGSSGPLSPEELCPQPQGMPCMGTSSPTPLSAPCPSALGVRPGLLQTLSNQLH